MIALAGAKGFAAALISAYATIFVVIVSLAVMAPAITAALLVPMTRRWPGLQRTHFRAALTGAVTCVVTAVVIWAIALVVANTLVPLDKLSPAMPFGAALTVGATFAFRLYHWRTFTRSHAVAIASASAVPVLFFAAMMM